MRNQALGSVRRRFLLPLVLTNEQVPVRICFALLVVVLEQDQPSPPIEPAGDVVVAGAGLHFVEPVTWIRPRHGKQHLKLIVVGLS